MFLSVNKFTAPTDIKNSMSVEFQVFEYKLADEFK